jgi:hypothetical protein
MNLQNLEQLENGDLRWLLNRKEELLKIATIEKNSCSISQLLALTVTSISAFTVYTSPLAPIALLAGICGYSYSVVADLTNTGKLNLLPFVRGGVFDTIGTLGHSELRQEYLEKYNAYDQIKEYLSIRDYAEFSMLTDCLDKVSEVLNQVVNNESIDPYVKETAISALSRLELVTNYQRPE